MPSVLQLQGKLELLTYPGCLTFRHMRTVKLNFTPPALNLPMHLKHISKTYKMLLKATGKALKWLVA